MDQILKRAKLNGMAVEAVFRDGKFSHWALVPLREGAR